VWALIDDVRECHRDVEYRFERLNLGLREPVLAVSLGDPLAKTTSAAAPVSRGSPVAVCWQSGWRTVDKYDLTCLLGT
jgi:hypothetical protein